MNCASNSKIKNEKRLKEGTRTQHKPKHVQFFHICSSTRTIVILWSWQTTQRAPTANLVLMKKSSGTTKNLGSFLSPGAPNYSEKSIGSQKGWSSERALQQASSSRMHTSVAGLTLTPFSSGRTMPSKWDDAERWISSPVLGYANNKGSCTQPQRRPKSKSGPIVPPGTAYYSNYSPTIPLHQGLVVRNLMVGSPFTTGVLAPDALSVHHFDSPHDAVFGPRFDIGNVMQCSGAVVNDNGVALSSVSSAPTWSELLCEPSSPNSQDENLDGSKNEDTVTSPLSTRDKGTQMSPPDADNDAYSSPKSSSPTSQKKGHSTKLETRDVQVDSQATVIRRSKIKGHATKLTEELASCLDIAESTLDTTKIQREEAKIAAWESLQKAKAEAAIRKLEMTLEKKRSWTMDKILNKLRRAQMKAEKMRSSVQLQQQGQLRSKPRKVFSFPEYVQIMICSPSRCFSHAS